MTDRHSHVADFTHRATQSGISALLSLATKQQASGTVISNFVRVPVIYCDASIVCFANSCRFFLPTDKILDAGTLGRCQLDREVVDKEQEASQCSHY